MNRSDTGDEFAELCAPCGRRGHRAAVVRGVAKRGLVAFLAFAMAFGTTPAQMWAEGAEGIAEAVTQAAKGDGAAADNAAERGAATSADAGNAGADAAASSEGATAGEGSAAGAETASAVAQDASSGSAGASAAAAQQVQGSDSAVAVQSLSSSAKVYIQDSKDKNSSWSTKSGALKAGDTLWANMYDGYSSAANPGTWTYTWLAGTSASGSVSDYTEVVGTSQSLTVTDAMAGKYFICKVTADGKDYYGPAKSYGEGVNANYIPGPVLAAGQAELYSVKLSNSSPSVGDTLTATPYTDYSTVATADTKVTYTWSYADSSYGDYATIEGATGDTLELTGAYKGKYIKVSATAGVNTVSVKTSDPVLGKGAVKLAGVELSASSTEIGATLTAKAYTGSSYSPTYVDNSKVTYTWKKYKGTSSPSYSTTWETIEGESGPTLTVTDDLEGCYVTVSANAGANDVTFGSYSDGYGVGPFKQAGAVDIYSVILAPAGSTSGSYVYCVGDTVQALAKEKGASDYIDASKLNFQWRSSDAKNGEYVDIAGATSSKLKLDSSLEGKFVKCVVSSKIGSSSYTSRATNMVAKAGSVNITSLTLSATGKVNVGDTLTATAKAGSSDVTEDEHVAWSWYTSDDSGSTAVWTKVAGATGSTLDITDAMLGKYIKVCANGGYGDEEKTAGPVVEAGAVSLHHVELSGSAKVGNALTADAYVSSYTKVSPMDKVHYQWQYADTKTTSDALFKNIEGTPDSPTYVLTEAMVGKYIRVKATSDGSVVSTYKKGSYSSSYVDPLGPVTLAGQYELTAVEIENVSSTILQVGRTITPQAKVASGYYDKDAPADAKLTYTWYAKGTDDADWLKVTDGVAADGTLTIGEGLAGKSLKVEAYALANTVTWTSGTTVAKAGEYNLLRVITTPQASSTNTHLVAGDTVAAEAQSLRADGSATNGIKVSDGVTFSWYVADSKDGAFYKLVDVEGASITVPDAAAGKYLKVVATSGASSVETVFENPVIDRNSIDAVVQKLSDASVRPAPVYGEDTNINAVLEAKIAELGFEGVTAKVKSVTFSATDAKATVGISAADDKTNGNVTYFYMDPNDYTGYNFDGLRSASVTFELTKDGKTAEYKPRNISVPWNEDMLEQRLDNVAEQLAIGYAAGDSAESVTGSLTLPYRAGSTKKFEVTWESTSDQVKVDGYGWEDYTGKVTRAGADRTVALTATVKLLSNAGGSDTDITGSHTFNLTVKGDPEKVAADKKALQAKVDAGFTYDNVKYSGTETVADKDGLTDDLQMSTTRTLGIDGKYYQVKYTASTDDVAFNGYKGTVYRPEPGKDAAATKITLTVTDKSNPEISATKTLDYQIKPFEQTDLDNELKLMEAAKAGYAQAILNGQDAKSVTENLHAFQKAYFDTDGNLAWTYDRDATDAAPDGIVPVELPGYDDMGTQGWRLFKSSNNAILQHENLNVTQPEYNTKVTIASSLSSEKYERYAERYPDNATYAKLANQTVTATVIVKGTSGQQAPEVSSTCSVIGVDANGNRQTWAAAQNITLKNGSTAADLSEQFFMQNGLNASYNPRGSWGWALNWIVSPFDSSQKLAYDAKTGNFWQLFINGEAASVGAGNYTLEEGDSVVWAYSKYGDQAPTDSLSVSCEIIGQDASGKQESWAIPTTIDMPAGSTASDLTDALFKKAGITADTGTASWGWYLNSITSPNDKANTLSTEQVDANTWKYWQFLVNGEMASVGAGNYVLKAGDKVSWVYGSDGTMPGQVSVSMEVIGQKNGKPQRWTDASNQVFLKGTTVKDATAAYFDALGIESKMYTGLGYWGVNSVTSPLDGTTLSGKWTFFVNGVPGTQLDENYELQAGDKVVWAYDAGDTVPDPDEVVVDPSAKRPTDWKADWDGKSDAAVSDVSTPTGAAASEWTFDYKAYSGSAFANASEPIIVNGYVYLAVNKRLLKIDSKTGKVEAEANLKSAVGYTSRPVYANGLVIVPLDGGAVQALTADALATVWVTDAVSDDAQSNSTLTVDGDYVYVATTGIADAMKREYNDGHLICINMRTGAVAWHTSHEDEGYYWVGATVAGDFMLMPTSSGTVELLDKSTGSAVSSLKLDTSVSSSCVLSEDGTKAYLVSYDGLLHVIDIVAGEQDEATARDASGSSPSLKLEKTVNLGLTRSACYPTVSGSMMFIGGEVSNGSALAMVNLDDLSTKLVTTADGAALPAGGIKGAPLVTTQNGKTFVYFTINNATTDSKGNVLSGGGVYGYELDAFEASVVYNADGHNEYCDSPVACDKDGNLYYINDSGSLFKLISGIKVSFDSTGGSFVASGSALKDGKLTRPADPTRKGYTFAGWFTDADCKNAYDFNTAVTSAFTLYAKWTKNPEDNKGEGNGGSGGGSGSVDNGGSNKTGTSDEGNGSGTAGKQAGGAVTANYRPVSSKTETATEDEKSSDDKSSNDKKSKKTSKDSKKAGSSSSSSGSSDESAATAHVAKGARLDAAYGVDAINPWAIAGVVVGVVGLALIAWFVFGRRKEEDDDL